MPVRSGKQRPLLGRIVLVVGAGDATARQLALHLCARGAAIVAAGPRLPPLLETAGLVAATHGVARVIEAPAPPLAGDALLRAAAGALGSPTDAVVAESAFADAEGAAAALADLARALPTGGHAIRVAARPAAGAKAEAERLIASWLEGHEGNSAGALR